MAVASVRGELDISNSAATGDAIASELQLDARGLIVDFSELELPGLERDQHALQPGAAAGGAPPGAARGRAAGHGAWRACSTSSSSTAPRPVHATLDAALAAADD